MTARGSCPFTPTSASHAELHRCFICSTRSDSGHSNLGMQRESTDNGDSLSFCEVYDSPIIALVLFYNSNTLWLKNLASACSDGRPEETIHLTNLWHAAVSWPEGAWREGPRASLAYYTSARRYRQARQEALPRLLPGAHAERLHLASFAAQGAT